MNKYFVRPRLGKGLHVFARSDSEARRESMEYVYGPTTSQFPNYGEGLAVDLISEDVQLPEDGVLVAEEI